MSKPILALNSIRGQSGKDTLIDHIQATGLKVHRVAFADTLKRECSKVLAHSNFQATEVERRCHTKDKDRDYMWLAIEAIPSSPYQDWLEQRGLNVSAPRSRRWHLQQYGTEYIREHLGKPTYWLDQGCEEIEFGLKSRADLVVVTDMRLPNEYNRMAKMDARLIRIVRNWFNPNVDTDPYHQSDIALMAHAFDALVVNEFGKPEAMYDQIKEFL